MPLFCSYGLEQDSWQLIFRQLVMATRLACQPHKIYDKTLISHGIISCSLSNLPDQKTLSVLPRRINRHRDTLILAANFRHICCL